MPQFEAALSMEKVTALGKSFTAESAENAETQNRNRGPVWKDSSLKSRDVTSN